VRDAVASGYVLLEAPEHIFFEEEISMLKKGSGTPEQSEITAFLGKGTEFKGVLSFEGTVRVDGKVEGEVISKDTLIAGDGALLQGEITVGTIISSGKVIGNINAGQKAHILAPAHIQGNIRTPKLIIEEGVIFDGKCEMTGKAAEQKAPEQKPGEQKVVSLTER
jgi:cytoskeletal protein CcmA (bactofilin family)